MFGHRQLLCLLPVRILSLLSCFIGPENLFPKGSDKTVCLYTEQFLCPDLNFINYSKQARLNVNEFLISKETVVLRRWERSKQKFGFIKRVDKGRITTVKDLES